MKKLEDKIARFATDPENVLEAQAMLVVGTKQGDTSEVVFSRIIAAILLRWEGIPYEQQQKRN